MDRHVSMVTNVCNIGLLVFASHGKIMSSHFPFKESSRLALNPATKVVSTHLHIANMSTDVHF